MVEAIFPSQRPHVAGRRISLWKASALVEAPTHPRPLRSRAKFLLRALTRLGLTNVWLSRLVQPDLAPLWATRPRLATKLQRPYVSAEWGPAERFAALLGHYELLPGLLAAGALQAIYTTGLDLVRLKNTSTGRQLTLRLFYQDQFEKEGELTLAVMDDATGLPLAGLTFCLARSGGRRVAIVGGLQAFPDPRIRTLIHDVAKEMHGLRPKAFALWGLRQIAVAWQIERLEGVCDGQHIYRHRHKRRNIAACYDEFWRESDGCQLPGGGWELPLQPRPRRREELKASRRKQHERRDALLGGLQTELLAALADLAPGPQAARALAAGPREFSYASRESAPPVAIEPPGEIAVNQRQPAATLSPARSHAY
ncbi:MAG: VirK/YbjX family protein [Opitutales bacterium]